MKLTLNVEVTNATDEDLKRLRAVLMALTQTPKLIEKLLRKGKTGVVYNDLGTDEKGRASFAAGRCITISATKEGK